MGKSEIPFFSNLPRALCAENFTYVSAIHYFITTMPNGRFRVESVTVDENLLPSGTDAYINADRAVAYYSHWGTMRIVFKMPWRSSSVLKGKYLLGRKAIFGRAGIPTFI
jgi:hypothetical protein